MATNYDFIPTHIQCITNIILLFICSTLATQDYDGFQANEIAFISQLSDSSCHNIYAFENAAPRDGTKSGIIEEFTTDLRTELDEDGNNGNNFRACLSACCDKERNNNTCNVVFIFKYKCYHVKCANNAGCLPNKRINNKERLQMFLVNPVRNNVSDDNENLSWSDILKNEKYFTQNLPLDMQTSEDNTLRFWKQQHKLHYPSRNQESVNYDDDNFPITEKRMKYLLPASTALDDRENLSSDDFGAYSLFQTSDDKYTSCDSEYSQPCPLKEECVPRHTGSSSSICKCISGYMRNHLQECVAIETASASVAAAVPLDYKFIDNEIPRHRGISSTSLQETASDEQSKESTQSQPIADVNKKLLVSVVSKEVQLPEKEVTLSAFTVPDEKLSNTKYKYLWTLIQQPKGPMNGTISDQTKSKVKLSNLSEGLYIFKVTVTGDNGTYGDATANVTVLPEKRINRIPQVIITPSEQIIRQPTTNAVLDGSSSTDDDKIINWHWEVVSGPIGYQPKLSDVNTLQLSDLTSPGNYSFKLTVTDSDNVTNSTTANITVLKVTDYPPVANAGDAVILYLPNNNVTLNGTASSDDHEIVAWEWTKDASVETKAVDMQNTRTPYVQLSNLEEGVYEFVLKVTDGSGQSNSAKVRVFVKPPTNSPPVAIASSNATINLPQNWVLLNGSKSTDDMRIIAFYWRQISGPNNAIINDANYTIANATQLTLGLYQFELTVIDENNNNASDSTWIKVVQEKNAIPVANAGGDQSITLPTTAIYLNGSMSTDDLGIVKYVWTRDETSLAAGTIVGDTDRTSIMILTNLVHGRYVFKLTVYDDQGLSSSDTVSVIVHPDPMLSNLIELTLPMGISVLTEVELNVIIQKIELLLVDMKIHVRQLKYDLHTKATVLVFFVEAPIGNDNQLKAVNGLTIERLLKDKFRRDVSILGTVFSDVRTTVCQNNCSNHGVCNDVTRACICEAFWMPSAYFYWGFDEANCDWSILYVFVSVIVSILLFSGIFWGISCACRKQAKKTRSRPKVQKYSLIGTHDEEAPNFNRSGASLTDSDTDSDVLFETRTKPNGILRSNGSSKNKQNSNKYASTKLSRKVKT